MEIRTIDPYFSFTEGTDIQNNSNSESEDENVIEEPSLDKIEETYNPNANNIIEIQVTTSLYKKITL